VEDSFYEGCLPGKVCWSKDDDRAIASCEVTELSTFTPRDPPSFELPWDSCTDLKLPTTSCKDFPCQRITPPKDRTNTEPLTGICFPNTGNPEHPNEQEWSDFSCSTELYHPTVFDTTLGVFAGIITAVIMVAKYSNCKTS
jgi:hypothetical protein